MWVQNLPTAPLSHSLVVTALDVTVAFRRSRRSRHIVTCLVITQSQSQQLHSCFKSQVKFESQVLNHNRFEFLLKITT